jgi:hypothetical protein
MFSRELWPRLLSSRRDAEASAVHKGMMRYTSFTNEGGAEALSRSSDSRRVRAC